MSDANQTEETIIDAARNLPLHERTRFLEKTCGADTELRGRVESQLSDTPTKSAVGPSGTVISNDDETLSESVLLAAEETIGASIGRYKLMEKIGEGGFGMVYVAEQTEPVKRRVALKIIKLGMDTRQVVARFEAERQALALMDHPNIAKVLDAGATDTGRPYFVMELVRGVKITEHCDKNNLSTRDRLDLFIQVCRAIEHAHQKGIIHRDIKPSNILITAHGGPPVPKVIDFGIAKATQGHLTDKTVYTQMDQFVGTPAYMSPEQAEAGGLDIDTRGDIYSLGVLLYELLTGETPLESKTLLAHGYDEMRRLIREAEPQRPSTRLNKQEAEEKTTIARKRGTETHKLIRMVRGDLDWVVMKCLEKDRSRRYATAGQLMADIQRFLDDEPVLARPPSNVYRFKKLVRRNKLLFAAGSMVFVSLIAGLCITSWFVVKEKDERDTAEKASENSDRARKVAEAAVVQAEAARQQSDIDKKHAEVSLQQSEIDRAKALAAEKKAEAAQKEAELSRQQAEAALKQSIEDRTKAGAAEKQAQTSESAAQSALQRATTAEAAAAAETAKREAADKSAADEAARRKAAEAARAQAEVSLEKAGAALKQAETAATLAMAETAAANRTVSNFLVRLDTLPPAEALKATPDAPSRQPLSAEFLRHRGEWFSREGDWTNAVADFSKALALDPANSKPYGALALLFAETGDTNALAAHWARFAAQFGASSNPSTARDFLIAPLAASDSAAIIGLALRSSDPLTLGLAQYRNGHYGEATNTLGKAVVGAGRSPWRQAAALAALAMAQERLQQTGDARTTLDKARQIIFAKLPNAGSGDFGPDWPQWIAAHTLVREATAMIGTPAATK